MWIALILIVEITGVGILLYFFNKTQKRRNQIYSVIKDSDSIIIPLQNIASALQMDFVSLTKDIKTMSYNGYYPLLRYSHIDISRQILVLSQEKFEKAHKIKKDKSGNQKLAAIKCERCGATNKSNSTECEYCGSPL